MNLTLNAYAKINLFLDVVGRLENGYHSIRSLMQSISLCDRVSVTVEEDGDPSVTLSSDVSWIPTDGRNLAVRAANAFYAATGEPKRTHVEIRKRIPASAGLAGGSTDAAAVLVALNLLFGSPFSEDRLCEIGKTLGADVPFCIRLGTAEVTGIGEKIRLLPPVARFPIAVAKLGEGVSTPEAYRALDERYGYFAGSADGGTAAPETYEALLAALQTEDGAAVADGIYNIFEEVVLDLHKEARSLREFFLNNRAIAAMMSGSGPSVFAIFASEEDAARAVARLNAEHGSEVAFCAFPVSAEDRNLTIEKRSL